jgi:hypothetical protein
MTALWVRPTVRCLREDLAIAKLPPADLPLDRIDHPILRKANATFPTADAPGERVAAIDDVVLFKVKIQRWRGAVWRPIPDQWLVAAGRREAGSPDDFYADLAARGRQWRAEANATGAYRVATDTHVERLLPTEQDHRRLALEEADRRSRAYEDVVPRLVRLAADSGEEERDEAAGYTIGVLIERRELDEVYVGLRIVGRVSVTDHAAILARVQGTDIDSWFIDTMPHRPSEPGEIVWSTLIDLSVLDET